VNGEKKNAFKYQFKTLCWPELLACLPFWRVNFILFYFGIDNQS